MIGDDSITSLVAGSPIITGNEPSLMQPATAFSANGAGSSNEMNLAPSTANSVCTAIRDRCIAVSRVASLSFHAVVFSTAIDTLTR